MNIYVAHSTAWDYQLELYEPLINSRLSLQYQFLLPHQLQKKPEYSKEKIETADLILAEVSYPSTGLGIELGWAHVAKRPILFIHQKNCQLSSSLLLIGSDFLSYQDKKDLIVQLEEKLRFFQCEK